VLLPAAAVCASGEATLRRLGGPGAWLLALPVSAIAGLQVLCRSVLGGTDPTVLASGEPLAAAVARMPAGRRYTALVPTQLRRYLDAGPAALRAFDAVLVGGAATDAGLLAGARDAGVSVVTTYGMTETAGGCVYDGEPLDGVRVRVADAGDAAGPGGVGIELAGPVLATGYRLDPEGTAAAFAGGWFRTRDAGSLDDAGRLTVHGRLDDVVVTGGVNVAPQAVEGRAAPAPGRRRTPSSSAGRTTSGASGCRRRRPGARRGARPRDAAPVGGRAAGRARRAARAAPDRRRPDPAHRQAGPPRCRRRVPRREVLTRGHPRPVAGRRPPPHAARRPRPRCSWAPAPPRPSTASGR
jgi:acyl-CoA synthetase (AMP-forming)/AMP-acid ligase II